MRGTFLQLVFLVIGLGHALPLESSFNQTQNVDSHQNPRMSINAFPGSDLPLNSPSQPKAKKITKNWRQRFFQGPQKSRRSADKFQNLQYNPRLTCHVDEECIHVDARLRCKTALAPLVASVDSSPSIPGKCECLSGLHWNTESRSCQSSRFWFNLGLLVMGVVLLLMLFGLVAYFVMRVRE